VLVAYSKRFSEALFDDIVVDFTIGSGKLVTNKLNKFYFQAFKSSK